MVLRYGNSIKLIQGSDQVLVNLSALRTRCPWEPHSMLDVFGV